MNGEGVARLSKSKSTKVSEISQNTEAFAPNAQTRLSQALLSLNVYCKTGLKGIVKDLSRLGHGTSYTQTMINQTINHRVFRLIYESVKWLHTFSITLTGKIRTCN